MRKLLAATALAALMMIAPAASAQDRTGFTLGARAAYGFPLGDVGEIAGVDEDDAFDNLVDSAFPIWLELNYRLGPSFEIGAYGQYAFTQGAGNNDDGSDIRAGLQINYIFTPGASVSPWIGIGGGYEWLSADRITIDAVNNIEATRDSTIEGWDFMVQGGADFHVGNRFTIGPFAAVTFGQFGDLDIDGLGSDETNIDDKAWHEWLQLGVRATFF